MPRFDSQERGWIDEATLDQQLDLINAQAAELHSDIRNGTREPSANVRSALLQSAQSLLTTLRNRLGWPVRAVRVRMVTLPKFLKLVW